MAPQVEEILGFSPEEWTDLAFWKERLHPDDRTWAADYCLECTARGEQHVFDYRFLTKDERYVHIRDVVDVEMDGDTPVKIRGFMLDITDRPGCEVKEGE